MFIPLYDHNPLEHIPRPYANWSIIAVTIAVFVVTSIGSASDTFLAAAWGLGLTPAYFLDGMPPPAGTALVPEFALLVTYALVHADLLHLGGNLIFLWVFGDNVEDALGHLKYVAFYALTAAAGGFLHVLMLPTAEGPLIGASGAVAGVVAAYLMLHPRTKLWILVLGRIPLRITARWPLAGWVAFQFLMASVLDDGGVAWWAHIGGLLAGAGLVVAMRRPGVALFDRDLKADRAG